MEKRLDTLQKLIIGIAALGVGLFAQMLILANTNGKIEQSLETVSKDIDSHEVRIQKMRIDMLEVEQKLTQKVHQLEINMLQGSKSHGN